MPKAPLVWRAELCAARNSAFRAQLGNLITYHVVSEVDAYPAYVEVRGPRGGLKRLDLGCYVNIEHAKRACEQHCAAGHSAAMEGPVNASGPTISIVLDCCRRRAEPVVFGKNKVGS